MPFANLREDIEQHVDTLARDAASNMQQKSFRIGESDLRRQFDIRFNLRELRRNPARRLHKLVFIDQPMPQDLLPHGVGGMKHDSRLLHSIENLPRHTAKPLWPRFDFRIEQATKRVEIVAKHARAIRWQDMHKLAVAVIG